MKIKRIADAAKTPCWIALGQTRTLFQRVNLYVSCF